MKRFLFVIASVFLLSACAQVFFTSPQPSRGVAIRSFPDAQLGIYSDSTLNVTLLKNKIIIEGDEYVLTTRNPLENEVLVKFYKNFYFASFLEEGYYQVFMAGFFDEKLAVYMLNADAYSIEVLNKFVAVDTLNTETETYLIDASRRQFDAIIDNELFDVIGVLSRE